MNQLSNYEEVQKLGVGSYGEASLVLFKPENKRYVMKRISLRNMDQKEQQRTVREAEIHHQFNHKNVVKYYASFQDMQDLIIIMEYCNSGTLDEYLLSRASKPLSAQEIHYIFLQVLLGLLHVHEKQVLHRDLSPRNVFMNYEAGTFTVKVGDFGLSKQPGLNVSLARSIAGTPFYIAPEIAFASGAAYGQKCDIWSLGCLLYALVTGKPPFYDLKAGYAKSLQIGKYIPLANQEIDLVVRQLIARDPAKRPDCRQILKMDWVRGLPQQTRQLQHPIQQPIQQHPIQQHPIPVVKAEPTQVQVQTPKMEDKVAPKLESPQKQKNARPVRVEIQRELTPIKEPVAAPIQQLEIKVEVAQNVQPVQTPTMQAVPSQKKFMSYEEAVAASKQMFGQAQVQKPQVQKQQPIAKPVVQQPVVQPQRQQYQQQYPQYQVQNPYNAYGQQNGMYGAYGQQMYGYGQGW